MARYLEVAADANKVARELYDMIREVDRTSYLKAAELIARLVNLGIRCSPRPVQSTVRLNAVREAVKGLPVKVWLEERTDERTGRSYKVLVTQPVGGVSVTETSNDSED